MGIRSTFDKDFHAIDIAGMADEMMAEVVADHAADRFRSANLANTIVAGGHVPYTVSVNGRTVHRGRGDLLPERKVSTAITVQNKTVRKLPVISIDWAWDSLNGNALQRAVANLINLHTTIRRVESLADFIQLVLNAREDSSLLLRYLLTRYAAHRYPGLAARLDAAKSLYRVYRIVRLSAGLLGGGSDDRSADVEVLAWIASELRDRSPFVSGDYQAAHALYADGKFLMNAADVSADMDLPDAEEFSFANTVPYARKIEFGTTKAGRDFVIQVPNRIYEHVAEDARSKFSGAADILFEMRAVIDARQTPQRDARKPHNQPDVRYPSIVVRF